MRFRGSTIRRKIVALLLVPLVALVSIWAFATFITALEAKRHLDARRVVDRIGQPIEETLRSVQRERRQVLVYLADPRRSDVFAGLGTGQRATDEAATRLRASAAGVRGEMSPDSRRRLDALLDEIDGLDSVRTEVRRNTVSRADAFSTYNAVVDPGYDLLSTLHAVEDVLLDKEASAVIGLFRARDVVSREDALLAAALAAGQMSEGELHGFSDRLAEREVIYTASLQTLTGEDQRAFEEYGDGPDSRALSSLEDAVVDAGADGALGVVSAGRWSDVTSTVLDDLTRLNQGAAERHEERIAPHARWILLKVGIAGVLGLLAVLVSIAVSLRIGRELVRELGTLRKKAHDVSAVRLPSVMRRLAAGEQVDVETEAPRLGYGPGEMDQVGQALNTLQRAAVEAAVKQAEMRRGVSEVFVNLARRNQVLLHRQLTLLDTMERRTEDADELEDLFRLDHLTTRMRRHAEGLVILSGVAPSRQWRKPVQLMDVIRAAVAEVEDYERIEVRRVAGLAVDGPAVADLTHLIAELLENATVFSPPHTAVQVVGGRVANGFTLEIHDRGLGMRPDALMEANLRLAEISDFELSDTDRLGLFVVARLAQRRGVGVSLQPSPYGGTTAVVLIPGSVLTETDNGVRDPVDSGREDTGGHGLEALRRTPAAPPARERPAVGLSGGAGASAGPRSNGGPVELEGPLDDLDVVEDRIGNLFRGHGSREETDGRHERVRHDRYDAAPAPLPQRRSGAARGPVLVSDHGRPVGNTHHEHQPFPATRTEARGEPRPARTPGGLPRRVRQASLAPQLRQDGKEPGDTGGTGDGGGPASVGSPPLRGSEPPAERDADEVRSRMSSLQRGWQWGRRENDRTTPEGDGR
jgi:Nitrate and nitrite sensing